jgi:hypothetical protein
MLRLRVLVLVSLAAALVFLAVACSDDDPTSSDSTPPTLQSTTPAAGAIDVAVGSDLVIHFSEAMSPKSSHEGRIYTTPAVLGDWEVDGDSITFSPLSRFVPNLSYQVTVTTRVMDASGNRLEAPYSWSFTTGDAPAPTPIEQELLYTRHFVNRAGEFDHFGWLIDSTGVVYWYDFVEDDSMWLVLEDKILTQAQWDKWKGLTVLGADTVPADVLSQMFQLTAPAAAGEYSDTSITAGGVGQLVTSAYTFDPGQNTYQQIELRVEGDTAYENLSAEALELHTRIVHYCSEAISDGTP